MRSQFITVDTTMDNDRAIIDPKVRFVKDKRNERKRLLFSLKTAYT